MSLRIAQRGPRPRLGRGWPIVFALLIAGAFDSSAPAAPSDPLSLHPDNPHYFLFRGKPTILVTSAEHYGAVLNLDFDYATYLDTLAKDGLNHTRVFSGAYVEPQGAFNIAKNTLAPAKGRFLCPWARSSTPGYAGGGAKFDLERFDPAYFERLVDFMEQASRRGVIVEMNLFCPFYGEEQWALSPQNAKNNVNGVGSVARTDVYTLDKHGGLLPVHEAVTRRIVRQLNRFDNLVFEICNEPYFGGVTLEWQYRIAEVIVETERDLPHRHLISRNVANGSQKIEKPHPAISIFNFHYATPPTAVDENWHLEKPIGDNETGFRGTGDRHYRMEGWEFLLAGGALYNNLDYSFTVGHEDGTFEYPSKQPGGGGVALRRQIGFLKRFVEELDFIRMKPDPKLVRGGVPEKVRWRALSLPGEAYAVYLTGGGPMRLEVDLPVGSYDVEWIDPVTGKTEKSERLRHGGGGVTLVSPELPEDLALRIRAAR